MLAVMKLMPESLLNYRFRGATMSYSELIVALENTIVDKVVTVPTARNKNRDTSAPMEIGMAPKEDGETASQEGDQRIMDFQKEPLAERQWQERRQRARERRQGRNQKDTLQLGACGSSGSRQGAWARNLWEK